MYFYSINRLMDMHSITKSYVLKSVISDVIIVMSGLEETSSIGLAAAK